MLNKPTITEEGKMFKSLCYYRVFKEANIPEIDSQQIICVAHYHEKPITKNKYRKLAVSKELLKLDGWESLKTQYVVPITREEFLISNRTIQNNIEGKLPLIHRYVLEPQTLSRILWSTTFTFLILLLICIYSLGIFAQGLTFMLCLEIFTMMIVSFLGTGIVTYTRTYYGTKIASAYAQQYDDDFTAAGMVVWTALDKEALSYEECFATLREVEGDDELAIKLLADVYIHEIGTLEEVQDFIEVGD